MRIIKNLALVVVNLIGELWIGVGRKPAFYDKHTATKTRVGYIVFVSLATVIALGTVIGIYLKIY